MNVIEVADLTKIFGWRGVHAVDGLSLEVPPGSVFGFLGPNGAGKTTTIRCLLGMVKPTSGNCRILGFDTQKNLHKVIGKVGTFVEAPGFLPTLTGKQSLKLLARYARIPFQDVDQVLDRVGLSEAADIAYGKYSLGMKQRLAIAAALLKDPAVLILDEPGNGLDPTGIAELRGMIKALAAEGRTIFLSSHLLSEVQQMCDHIAIVSKGRVVASGALNDLLGTTANRFFLRVSDSDRALKVLEVAGIEAHTTEGGIRVEAVPDPASLSTLLARANVGVLELSPIQAVLEDIFVELTEGGDSYGGHRT